MSNTLRRNLILSSVMIPLALGLAACGGGYDNRRHAEAMYLNDRGEALEDAALTSKVAALITEDRSLQGSEIHVTTSGNTVRLTGYVASRNDGLRAEDLAHDVPGVRRVHNDLDIR